MVNGSRPPKRKREIEGGDMTACGCEQPGWCERHQCTKTEHLHSLCRRRPDYFRLWEQGRGPGQSARRRGKAAPAFPCRRLGEALRAQECPTCCGTVKIKIFQCELHDECTLAHALAEAACCRTCGDYEREPAN
jgi:hypothetical protein